MSGGFNKVSPARAVALIYVDFNTQIFNGSSLSAEVNINGYDDSHQHY
jgi:hypothetical protein